MMRVAMLLLLAACEVPRTQMMIGVVTDLRAPNVIDGAKLVVTRADNGMLLTTESWMISGSPAAVYNLPGSFGVYSADGEEVPLDIELTGLKGSTPIVVKRSRLGLVTGKTLFVRMGLTAGCAGKTDCGPMQTCTEGACTDVAVDSQRLPDFEPALVTELTCNSGTTYINTSTGQPMPYAAGAEACPASQCLEGTCLRAGNTDGSGDGGTIDSCEQRAPNEAAPRGTVSNMMGMVPASGSFGAAFDLATVVDGYADFQGSVIIRLTDHAAVCGMVQQGIYKIGGNSLQIMLFADPVTVGTYTSQYRAASLYTAPPTASVGSCGASSLTDGLSGSGAGVTITAIDSAHVAGSFSFTLDGQPLSGTFDVPVCRAEPELNPSACCVP